MKKACVAIGALLVGGCLATSAMAQPVTDSVVTNTGVANAVAYDNTLSAALDASSANTIDLTIQGKVGVAGTVTPDSIGQSLVDGKQLLSGNTVTFLPTVDPATMMPAPTVVANTATLGTDAAGAFVNAEGNIGVNINAGSNNAQDNSIAITTVQSQNQGLKADVVRLQEAVGNVFNGTPPPLLDLTNTAVVKDGTFDGASGNIGANISAGYNIGQAGGLAVSVAEASRTNVVLASANAGTLQNLSGVMSFIGNQTNMVMVGAIGNNFRGNLSLNVASGSNILQNNSVAITAIKDPN